MVRRYLQWYDKKTEFSAGQEDLNGIGLEQLQELFNVPPGDPMYDCWEAKEEHLKKLQKHVGHTINLDKYSYYVESSS